MSYFHTRCNVRPSGMSHADLQTQISGTINAVLSKLRDFNWCMNILLADHIQYHCSLSPTCT